MIIIIIIIILTLQQKVDTAAVDFSLHSALKAIANDGKENSTAVSHTQLTAVMMEIKVVWVRVLVILKILISRFFVLIWLVGCCCFFIIYFLCEVVDVWCFKLALDRIGV